MNTSGITSATLTLNAFFNAVAHTASTNWGISYRFNGGTWRNRTLTAGDIASINAIAGAPLGHSVVVARCSDDGSGFRKQYVGTASAECSDGLSAGCRQYRFAFGDFRFRKSSPTPTPTPAPTVTISANPTNITSGNVSTVTWSSTNATSCTAAGGWTGTKATSGTLVGIADKYYDLHADLHRERRHVPGSQYDGSGECRPRRRSAACADRRTARRHRLNLRPTFAPPARRRPWRARARGHGAAAVLTAVPPRAALHRRDLHQAGGGSHANNARSCCRKLRHAVGQCGYLLRNL